MGSDLIASWQERQRTRNRDGRVRLQLQGAVYDCSDFVHAVNLFDIAQTTADVASTDGVIERLDELGGR